MDKTIVSILGGLGGMFGWGVSDFLANFSSDAVGHFKTFFWSQLVGMVLFLAVGVFLIPEFGITNAFYLALIVESGIAYALGYLFFYKAFEIGNVAIVSALINLQTIFVMVIAYALYGQRLSTYQYPAVLLLLVGVVLVSVDFGQLRKGAVSLVVGVKETVIAAVMFGILFWPVNEFLVERNDWLPINIYEKTVAIIFILLIAYIGKKSLSIGQTTAKTRINLIAVGLLEAVGILSVSFGISVGDSIIVQPIAASLTVVTVGLAALFLKEKVSKIQWAGIFLVIGGIILTSF